MESMIVRLLYHYLRLLFCNEQFYDLMRMKGVI
jgi:hypothetical protein